MNPQQLKNIIEAALLATDHPLSIDRILSLFIDSEQPSRDEIKEALQTIAEDYAEKGIELKEVSKGYRIQVKTDVAPWVSRLWEERPTRYSRALLETMVLIAYKQPVTRADIEDVRGVAVSSYIIKTLLEREWIRVLGHREVPGRPSLYGTTKEFLDYFGLKSLEELPPLSEIKDLDDINASLNFGDAEASDSSEKQIEEAEVAVSANDDDQSITVQIDMDSDESNAQQQPLEQTVKNDEEESLTQESASENVIADQENQTSQDQQASGLTANG